MKQLLQDMTNGSTNIVEAPSPLVLNSHVLISTTRSLISSGTERMLVGFGKASLINKARQQPEKVKMVMEKVTKDGLLTTFDAVKSKLAEPMAMGYCNVGVIEEVGVGSNEFAVGQRVVSNGPHADLVRVSRNLCALIPDEVDDDAAAFVVVASIGLQGVRLIQPTMGEAFVVIGTGLIGLLTVQLLLAQGCRVMAVDFDDTKLALARHFGAETCNPGLGEDPVAAGIAFSRGRGVDGVIIAASSASSDPVSQAACMCRQRGRIVLVGVTGLELNRADFYEKELSFQVSCSYGPGRYDQNYEVYGQDYPIGFVRWTEKRNFEAVLDMLASQKIDIKPLITHRFDFENAPKAYETLTSEPNQLGILLDYKSSVESRMVKTVLLSSLTSFVPQRPIIGFVGAGNYASRVLMPAFKAAGAQFHTVVTSGGINGVMHGLKAGFAKASVSLKPLLSNKEINSIVVVTRHDTHAMLAEQVLNAGKHVFVEKPLAIRCEELESLQAVYLASQDHFPAVRPQLMVGFNRRFSPQVMKIKSLLEPLKEPISCIITVNAGSIPADHWTQDEHIGGGRIIGEACHFIDLMRFIVGHPIASIQARGTGRAPHRPLMEDTASITLGFDDGSFGTILYLANGSAAYPKERIEIFSAGRVLHLNNFSKLKGYGFSGFRSMNLWKQDKGQKNCVAAFLKAIETGKPAIPIEEIFEVARVTIEVSQRLREQ